MSELWKAGTFSKTAKTGYERIEALDTELYFLIHKLPDDAFDDILIHSDDELTLEDVSAYLEHHGIKGQKWGVRRYQNTDGSLTAAGKTRYYQDKNRTFFREPATGFKKRSNVDNQALKNVVGYGRSKGAIKDDIPRAIIGLPGRNAGSFKQSLASRVKNNLAAFAGGMLGSAGGFLIGGPLGAAIGSSIGVGAGYGTTVAIRYNKERKKLAANGKSPEEVDAMTGSKKKVAITNSLAKGADDPTGFGAKFREYINKKLSDDTNKKLSDFDKKLSDFEKRYETATKHEQSRIRKDTIKGMDTYAKQMLKDMGWPATPQNIYYLTQIVWQIND